MRACLASLALIFAATDAAADGRALRHAGDGRFAEAPVNERKLNAFARAGTLAVENENDLVALDLSEPGTSAVRDAMRDACGP